MSGPTEIVPYFANALAMGGQWHPLNDFSTQVDYNTSQFANRYPRF